MTSIQNLHGEAVRDFIRQYTDEILEVAGELRLHDRTLSRAAAFQCALECHPELSEAIRSQIWRAPTRDRAHPWPSAIVSGGESHSDKEDPDRPILSFPLAPGAAGTVGLEMPPFSRMLSTRKLIAAFRAANPKMSTDEVFRILKQQHPQLFKD